MKLNKKVIRCIIKIGSFIWRTSSIVFAAFLLTLADVNGNLADPIYSNLSAHPPFVKIKATILDRKKHPIVGATFDASDAMHRPLEAPGLLAYLSDSNGRISYSVQKTITYFIEASAPGYLMSEVKVKSSSPIINVVFMLQKYPPLNKLHAIRAIIMDTQRHPIPFVPLLIFDMAHNVLQNPGHGEESDHNGRITLHIPVRKYYYLRPCASGYLCPEFKVPYNSQIIPIVLQLRKAHQI